MYYQYRRTRKKYHSFPATDECQFCHPQKYISHIFQETSHAYVIPNRTFYDHWELRKVVDHRMVIPKKHVQNFGELSKEELADIMGVIAEYETNDYEIYARSPNSSSRSVPHQHTHLIKTDAKPRRGLFFLNKPYILWLFR